MCALENLHVGFVKFIGNGSSIRAPLESIHVGFVKFVGNDSSIRAIDDWILYTSLTILPSCVNVSVANCSSMVSDFILEEE